MRIAFSGAHRVGKSTLLEQLEEQLPEFAVVDEPYHLLEEEGYEHSSPPSLEDFLEQLRRSIQLISEEEATARNVLFDRCPLDFIGYLLIHEDSDAFDLDEWLPQVREVLQTLDLIVFVPVEAPDRIKLPAAEDSMLRNDVHEKLAWIALDDPFDLGVEILAVHGREAERVRQVLKHLGR